MATQCPHCRGFGRMRGTNRICFLCGGSGFVDEKPAEATTPAIPEDVKEIVKVICQKFSYWASGKRPSSDDRSVWDDWIETDDAKERFSILAGAAHIHKQGDINDFPVTKELKWKVTQLIVADMSQLVGLDLTDRQMSDYQDIHAGELIDEILDAVLAWQQSKKPNTYVVIPSSIVRRLEEMNPYKRATTKTPQYRYAGYCECVSKLTELLSAQPAEQGEVEAKIKAEGIKQALNFVRNIFPVAVHQDQLKHAIGELEMFYANYLTDNTTHDQVQEIIP